MTQRTMIIFDNCLGKLDPDNEDEILIYHLIACLYINLKVESIVFGLSFVHFLTQIVQLRSYRTLQVHLAPHLSECEWTVDLYALLEKQILEEALRYKTNFVSGAEVIFQIACTFSEVNELRKHEALEPLIQEALFRSYLSLAGKSLQTINFPPKMWYSHNLIKISFPIQILSRGSLIIQSTLKYQRQNYILTLGISLNNIVVSSFRFQASSICFSYYWIRMYPERYASCTLGYKARLF